ncbi:MAG: hypothetical protein WC317_07100 [Candidatus Omnitrophota bacterium]|jgi:hypothetical protein
MKKIIVCVLLSFIISLSANAEESNDTFIHYRWSGGYSPLKNSELIMTKDGKARVVYARCIMDGEESFSYEFNLDKNELYSLRALVKAVDFFNQPETSSEHVIDAGESTLYVHLGERDRTIHFQLGLNIEPLRLELDKIISQGIIITEINTKEDVYEAMIACSPYFAGRKIYSPQYLKDPLEEFITKNNNKQKLEYALTALSWLLTQEQWLGFIASQIENSNESHKLLLLKILGSHPFYGNIPEKQAQILLPYLIYVIDSHYAAKKPLSQETDETLRMLWVFVACKGDEQILPVLEKLSKSNNELTIKWSKWAVENIKGRMEELKNKK